MNPNEMLERMAAAQGATLHDCSDHPGEAPNPDRFKPNRKGLGAMQAALHELASTKRQPHMDRMILATAVGLIVLDITELEL